MVFYTTIAIFERFVERTYLDEFWKALGLKMLGFDEIIDVASLVHWPTFLPIMLLPSSYLSK